MKHIQLLTTCQEFGAEVMPYALNGTRVEYGGYSDK
ncbi:MAG: hypothetical protein CM15mV5_3250 [uncultured marine virus]|nr:MAG: hypothetical protein CM15mV5_3250 [uncultured marine virus]